MSEPLFTYDEAKALGIGPCGLCGRDPAAGMASVSTMKPNGDWLEVWYCHDNPDPDTRSCYERADGGRVMDENTFLRWLDD